MIRNPTKIGEIDDRIAILRENLRELVEQAAAYSGAADDELTSRRIAEQQAQLELLAKQRDELSAKIASVRHDASSSNREVQRTRKDTKDERDGRKRVDLEVSGASNIHLIRSSPRDTHS